MPLMVNTPTFTHAKLAALLFKDADLSAYFNALDADRTIEAADVSAFGTLDKAYIPGMAEGKLSASGFFDGSLKAVDEYLNSAITSNVDDVATFFLNGGVKPGARCRMAYVETVSVSATSATGDVVGCKAEFTADGGHFGGRALTDKVAISATTTYPTVDHTVDFATATSGAFAHVHVIQNTRNVASTIKLQHSVDNSVWVDLAPTVTVNATTTQATRLDITGTVNRYVRAVNTLTAGTGTITAIVALSRK